MNNLICCSVLNFVNKYLSDGELADLTCFYFPIVKDAGFDGMEIFLRSPSSFDIKRIKKVSQKNHFPITSVHFPKTLLDEPRSFLISRLKELVLASLELDCDLGIVHPPWPGTVEQSWEKLILILLEVLPWAENNNFRLSVETTPIAGCDLYFKQAIEEIGEECFFLTLDLEFLATVGLTAGEFCRAVDLMPENIHVNEFDGSPVDTNGQRRYPLLGAGKIDYVKEGFNLKELGYEGIFTLETFLGHVADLELELVRSRELIFQKLVKE